MLNLGLRLVPLVLSFCRSGWSHLTRGDGRLSELPLPAGARAAHLGKQQAPRGVPTAPENAWPTLIREGGEKGHPCPLS